MSGPDQPGPSIYVDEIGIEIGCYGAFRLQSSYLPVFARRDDTLRPVAVQGVLTPFRDGVRVAPRDFTGSVEPHHRLLVSTIGSLLHIRNFHHICADWLDLFVDGALPASDADAAVRAVDLMIPESGEGGICAEQIVLGLHALNAECMDGVEAAFGRWRARGLRLMLDEPEVEHGLIARLAPDVIRLDPKWFGERVQTPEAARLVAAAVRGLQSGGARVLAPSIDTPRRLAAALAAGVDLMQGDLLGIASLVGVGFDERPLQIADLLGRNGGSVVALDRTGLRG